ANVFVPAVRARPSRTCCSRSCSRSIPRAPRRGFRTASHSDKIHRSMPIFVVRVCECRCMDEVLERSSEALCEYLSRPAFRLCDAEVIAGIVDLHGFVSLAIAGRATLVRQAQLRNLPGSAGSTSTVAWLRELLLVTGQDARRVVTCGELLDRRPVLAQ